MIPIKEKKEKNEDRGDGKVDVRVVFWRWRRIFSRDVELCLGNFVRLLEIQKLQGSCARI